MSEQPLYQILRRIDNFIEIREYPETLWACSSSIGKAWDMQTRGSVNLFGNLGCNFLN